MVKRFRYQTIPTPLHFLELPKHVLSWYISEIQFGAKLAIGRPRLWLVGFRPSWSPIGRFPSGSSLLLSCHETLGIQPDSDSTPPALRHIWNCLKALIWYLKLISYQSCQHCFLAPFAVWIQFSSKLSKIRFCSDMLKWFALKVLNIQFRSDLMKWFALKSPNINFGRIFQICPRWHFQYSS